MSQSRNHAPDSLSWSEIRALDRRCAGGKLHADRQQRLDAYLLENRQANAGVENSWRTSVLPNTVATNCRIAGTTIGAGLRQRFWREKSSLTRMARFAELFPDERILVSLVQELTWTHFIALLPLKDPLAREFYAEMCRVERWSVRALRQKINGMLFERTALSKNSEEVVRQELATLRDGQMTPDMVFRDPYLLDFLGLSGGYSEKDLEAAILREMESFLLEMGNGFCFVERQKRMSVGKDDFYLDLLFYHRHLRRLVAIELKLESFQPSHKGQMELYLRWLDKHERTSGEEPPIGLILCASADAEQIELLQLDEASIRVAEYLVELPPVAVLRERLHRAIEHARERTALVSSEGDQE
jgi:predicted nuclease of restriction endonuclease-like (RecB) superfamily